MQRHAKSVCIELAGWQLVSEPPAQWRNEAGREKLRNAPIAEYLRLALTVL
jgi:hypothetical protein